VRSNITTESQLQRDSKNGPTLKSQFRAPGRVNIIGEHTDYNDGFVLPTTTALYTTVTATARPDRIVEIYSRDMTDTQTFDLDDLQPVSDPGWIDYAKGVAAELEVQGIRLRGADLEVRSEIPLGGGLSSSASFELAIATALLGIADASLPKPDIAILCQRAENRYAGVNCGIMDQYTVACCDSNRAIFLDCRTLETRQVAIPGDVRLLLTDSGVRHRLPDSGYNLRADECGEAVRLLAQASPGLTALREVSMQLLESQKDLLGDVLYQRCRHVVSENQRVVDAFAAMQGGDSAKLGKLISESHSSLRDDFAVSCDAVEQLVTIADASTGVLGSRMVGAGFGGCVLSLVQSENATEAAHQIGREYTKVLGEDPWSHIVLAAEPAREFVQARSSEQP
jgi:galactokinase